MSEKYKPDIDLLKSRPHTRWAVIGLLILSGLLLILSLPFWLGLFPSIRNPDFHFTPFYGFIFVGIGGILTFRSLCLLVSIIKRNIIGVKCTVGVPSKVGAVYYLKSGHFTNIQLEPMAAYAHVRLGGWGNPRRHYDIYHHDARTRGVGIRVPLKLRVLGDMRFALTDKHSRQTIEAELQQLLWYVLENGSSLDVFKSESEWRRLQEQVASLSATSEQLGISLVAISERLRLVRPAYQSPHGELTSALCKEGLGQIPASLIEAWIATAHARWPWIFKPAKRGEPAPTLTPPTPTAEVSA